MKRVTTILGTLGRDAQPDGRGDDADFDDSMLSIRWSDDFEHAPR